MHDTWVAIDFETATNEPHSACALGLAVIEGSVVVETASWLIQPPANEYHWYCTRVHGLNEDHTAQSPEFDEVWPLIRPYLESGQLLAHNAPFDARVLSALIARHDLDAPELSIACTVAMSRVAFPRLPNHKLDTVCEGCGIALNHHEAESDALACAHVAIECAREKGAGSVTDAIQRLGVKVRAL